MATPRYYSCDYNEQKEIEKFYAKLDKATVTTVAPKLRKLQKRKSKDDNSLSLIVTGKTGTGKSTLLNGLLGFAHDGNDAAQEGHDLEACTTTCKLTKYKKIKDGIAVLAWDSPGLQDGTADTNSYIQQMQKICSNIDLVLYCIDMSQTRFIELHEGSENPDVVAMKKLTEAFGDDFWRKTIIVLTFANMLEYRKKDTWDSQKLSPADRVQAFNAIIQNWKEKIKVFLSNDAEISKEIVDSICIVPAGWIEPCHLMGQKFSWLADLWFQITMLDTQLHFKMATPDKQHSGLGRYDFEQLMRSNATTKPSTRTDVHGRIRNTNMTSVMSKLLPKGHAIKFYSRYDDYYEFTNFYHHPIQIDGHYWPTTENYFQAQKFVGTPYYDHIRTLPFPRDAIQVSHDPKALKWIRRDWNIVKDDVMLKALRVKFRDDSLKHKLLCTKDKSLVLHTSNDSYWGDGGDGRGLNKLGHLLMQVRHELRQTEPSDADTDCRKCPIGQGAGRLRRSNSFCNTFVTTTPITLRNFANHSCAFSCSLKSSKQLKMRRNSICSHSSIKDLKPSSTTNQQCQITCHFGSHRYSLRGNSREIVKHGDTDYSHDSHLYRKCTNSDSNSYRYSKGPYSTPDLTRKPITPPTS